MLDVDRKRCPYTAFFCEENIWHLARAMLADRPPCSALEVLFFSNPSSRVLLFEQRAADPAQAVIWDYHVVLRLREQDRDLIFDPDSRLSVPTPTREYLRATFPPQDRLPEAWRTLVKRIPADSYVRHFYSDRSHMRDSLPEAAFPPYPIIEPAPGVSRVPLADYRDMSETARDGHPICPVEQLLDELAKTGCQSGR